jgi:molybdenum cofactor biosynthesis enzyme MoaA
MANTLPALLVISHCAELRLSDNRLFRQQLVLDSVQAAKHTKKKNKNKHQHKSQVQHTNQMREQPWKCHLDGQELVINR